MADHAQVEYGVAEGNDLPAHEETYERFTHLALIGSCHVASIIIGLAIGATTHHWFVAFCIFFVASIVAAIGALNGSRMPSMVMVVISLLLLAFTAAG